MKSVPKYSLEEILDGKAHIEGMLHPLPAFREYLSEGYYPFAIEGDFPLRMQNVITKIIESDIAQYAGLRATTAKKPRKCSRSFRDSLHTNRMQTIWR